MQDCFDIVFNSKTFMSVQIDLKKKSGLFFKKFNRLIARVVSAEKKSFKNVLMPQFTWLIRVLDIGGGEQLLTPRDDLKTFSSKREEKKLLEIVALCSVQGK